MKIIQLNIVFLVLLSFSTISAQWTQKTSGLNDNLTAVHFPISNIGYGSTKSMRIFENKAVDR